MSENHNSLFEKRPEPVLVESASIRDRTVEASEYDLIGVIQADAELFAASEAEYQRQLAGLEQPPVEGELGSVAADVSAETTAKVANAAMAELLGDEAPAVNTAMLNDMAADIAPDAASDAPDGENWTDVGQDDVELAA